MKIVCILLVLTMIVEGVKEKHGKLEKMEQKHSPSKQDKPGDPKQDGKSDEEVLDAGSSSSESEESNSREEGPASSEDRIIGGEEVTQEEELPFMAVFNFKPASTVKCTASLISSHWLISAAHCLVAKEHFIKRDGGEPNPDCANYLSENLGLDADCIPSPNQSGDLIVQFKGVRGRTSEVMLGVQRFNEEDAGRENTKKLVDKIIVHKKGYLGGMYGEYGGYDIILIKLQEAARGHGTACIPAKHFDHAREGPPPMIGGYGRYRRVPCETNDRGPEVYKYCKVAPDCNKGKENFIQATCDVQFNYNNQQHTQCITEPTPTASNPECTKFKKIQSIDSFMTYMDRGSEEKNINEVIILDSENRRVTACYRENAGKFGWCGTTTKIVTGDYNDQDHQTHVEPDRHWGVCQKICDSKEHQEHLTGVARHKEVEILDQNMCDGRLKKLRMHKDPPNFHVMPLVYCVAHNESYKTEFWREGGDGRYHQVRFEEALNGDTWPYPMPKPPGGRRGRFYHRATGSCKGDSGGPLYMTCPSGEHVVLGTTSRGTGPIGNCGGEGNPTHYVRVKDMNKWIKSYVTEDLCELDSCSGGGGHNLKSGGGNDYVGAGDQAGYTGRGLGASKSHEPHNFPDRAYDQLFG